MSGASTIIIKSIFKFEFVWSMCVCCVLVFLAISEKFVLNAERKQLLQLPCDYNNQNRRHGEKEKKNATNMYTKEAIVFKADGVPLYFTSAPKGNEIKQSMRKMCNRFFFFDSLRCCVCCYFSCFAFALRSEKASEMLVKWSRDAWWR